MLDYAGLDALSSAVREGSFERAARALHITASAASQRIKSLETRVGCTLVVRGQPCVATDIGRRLCRHAEQVGLLELELRESLPMLGTDQNSAARLSVAVNADSLATWFAPALAEFAALTPVLVDVSVDDQDHTARWLRDGSVLAAVSGSAQAATGCDCRPLGALRYVAAATPAFMHRHFANGVSPKALARAPSLLFNHKDDLQDRWVRRRFRRSVELPRHVLPSPHAFVTAALHGMGWGLHPLSLVDEHLRDGSLVELVPDAALDVQLYWQQARVGSYWLDELGRAVQAGARRALRGPNDPGSGSPPGLTHARSRPAASR